MGAKKQSQPIEEIEIPIVGKIKAGKLLEHPVFGVGEVAQIAQWESGEITIGINFKKHGQKWLVPEYANLSEPKKLGIFSRLFSRKKE